MPEIDVGNGTKYNAPDGVDPNIFLLGKVVQSVEDLKEHQQTFDRHCGETKKELFKRVNTNETSIAKIQERHALFSVWRVGLIGIFLSGLAYLLKTLFT